MTVNAIFLVRRYMPAPYLFALVLTFVAAILAMTVTRTPPSEVVDYWYRGLWDILTFTMQMVLVLMCGHALVDAPLVKRGLDWFSTRPKTERQAGILVFLIGWATALFNWGFCLVVVGVMVREIPPAGCREYPKDIWQPPAIPALRFGHRASPVPLLWSPPLPEVR